MHMKIIPHGWEACRICQGGFALSEPSRIKVVVGIPAAPLTIQIGKKNFVVQTPLSQTCRLRGCCSSCARLPAVTRSAETTRFVAHWASLADTVPALRERCYFAMLRPSGRSHGLVALCQGFPRHRAQNLV